MSTGGLIDSFKLEDRTAILASFISRIDTGYTLRTTYTDKKSNPRYVYFVWANTSMVDIEWDLWGISDSEFSFGFDQNIDINISPPSGSTWNKATLTVDISYFPSLELTLSTTSMAHILGDHPDVTSGTVETVYRVDDMLGRHYHGRLVIQFLAS